MILETSNQNLKIQIQKMQMVVLVISLFLMAIGGCVFGLGVHIRTILRLVHHENRYVVRIVGQEWNGIHFYFLEYVKTCCQMLNISGLLQIGTAGFCSFTSNWGLYNPMWMAMSLVGLLVCLESSALGLMFYVASQADVFSTENIFRAWKIWECDPYGSCYLAYLNYVYYYKIPQALLTSVAILLQFILIMHVYRTMKCIKARREAISKPQDGEADALSTAGASTIELRPML